MVTAPRPVMGRRNGSVHSQQHTSHTSHIRATKRRAASRGASERGPAMQWLGASPPDASGVRPQSTGYSLAALHQGFRSGCRIRALCPEWCNDPRIIRPHGEPWTDLHSAWKGLDPSLSFTRAHSREFIILCCPRGPESTHRDALAVPLRAPFVPRTAKVSFLIRAHHQLCRAHQRNASQEN